MKWKVEFPDNSVLYCDPDGVEITMGDCILKNRKSTADKIYNGANKSVCAWILCKTLNINVNPKLSKIKDYVTDDTERVRYNPKVKPNWLIGDEVSDGKKLDEIRSIGKSLYTNSKPY